MVRPELISVVAEADLTEVAAEKRDLVDRGEHRQKSC